MRGCKAVCAAAPTITSKAKASKITIVDPFDGGGWRLAAAYTNTLPYRSAGVKQNLKSFFGSLPQADARTRRRLAAAGLRPAG
jgi:hypothetical protein